MLLQLFVFLFDVLNAAVIDIRDKSVKKKKKKKETEKKKKKSRLVFN